MSLINKALIKQIASQYVLSLDGIHGLGHWSRVLANGRKLSRLTGANLNVVELFAMFHDCRRFNDGSDPEHGLRGALLAVEKRGDWFDISDGEMDLLFEACSNHTSGISHPDITVQTCWDADRLDIGRVGIRPNPNYLCTDAAKSNEMLEWAHFNRHDKWVRTGEEAARKYLAKQKASRNKGLIYGVSAY